MRFEEVEQQLVERSRAAYYTTELVTLKEIAGEYTGGAAQAAYAIDQQANETQLFFLVIAQYLPDLAELAA